MPVSITPSRYPFLELGRRWRIFTDCEYGCGASGAADWVASISGTGANVALGTPWASNIVGVVQLALGTTTTGRAALHTAGTTMKHGAGKSRFAALVYVHTLSTGTETYSTRAGFIDAVSGESVDGIFFRYTDSSTGATWHTVTRQASTETVTTATGVTVAASTAYKLYIEINDDASEAKFFINGALVSTHTANIPGQSRDGTGVGIMALKSAGTTSTSPISIDFIEADQIFTTPRW